MPLIKSTSKQAFAKNVKAELAAGRPLKQSLAIAYSTRREAAKSGDHHSDHSARRSRHYHSSVIEGTTIGRGRTKMTRQESVRGKNEEAWDR